MFTPKIIKAMLLNFQTPLLLFGLFLVGCISPEKFQLYNTHDTVVLQATHQLEGKWHKTKWVKVLESSFVLANEQDLWTIDSLKTQNTPAAWEKIYALQLKIRHRQEKVMPLLPLKSSDGNQPAIQLLPIEEMLEESRLEIIADYTDEIEQNIELARNGNRFKAREAYTRVDFIQNKYGWDAPLAKQLSQQAVHLGMTNFLLEIATLNSNSDDTLAIQQLGKWKTIRLSLWQNIYNTVEPSINYHFRVKTTITNSNVSSDSQNSIYREESKRVLVGQEKQTDANGVDQFKPIYENVSATIEEISARKYASLTADFEAFDFTTNQLLRSETIKASSDFNSSFSVTHGVSGSPSNKTVNFPSDFDMMGSCVADFVVKLKVLLKEIDVSK